MAANWKGAHSVASSFGKRLLNQIWIAPSPPPPPSLVCSTTLRRAAHTSLYDKNLDEEVRPSVVPDEIVQPQSDKYWAPHPRTGVFGPAAADQLPASGEEAAAPEGGQSSVLEEKAWFRPTSLEDLEKPHNA